MNKLIYHIFILSAVLFCACGSGTEESTGTGIQSIESGVNPDSWIRIPAGEFLMGLHEHETMVGYDYEIMATDVTNAQYADYLNEALEQGSIKIAGDTVVGYYPGDRFDGYNHEIEITAGDKPHVILNEVGNRVIYDRNSFAVERGYENHPMVMVTWFGAKAYADFYGWRLPAEIEWEKAARGTDGRAYPWGNEISRNQANFYSSLNLFQKLFEDFARTTPVGFYNGKQYGDYQTLDGRSPYGLYDMAGNVWQWTGDDYPHMHLRFMRGGSQANYEYNLRIWTRNSAGPDFYGINIGFRCARNVQ
jgi:formylglycine-generating enzyme